MDADTPSYAELPRLRARLAALTAEGLAADAERTREEIRRRIADAKRAAEPLLTERRREHERFHSIVQQIRELEGAIAETSGSGNQRDTRIRELTRQARAVNAKHALLTEQIREIRRCVTAVDRPRP
ncbi:MAG: hypothetical protein EA382_13305 [Spirochaetaceae bacterium]|nr:MAG: hypothetical protein EA382_13305 [Spirochaetaceae bacterium]